MSELTPQLAAEVLAACQANTAEIAAALQRAFDAEVTLTVGLGGTFTADQLASGPGLAVLFTCEPGGLVAVIAEQGGLIPDWYQEPDAAGKIKLSTLAQELSRLMVPESVSPSDVRAARIGDLATAVRRAGAVDGAAVLRLELTGGDKTAALDLIWPVTNPGALFDEPQAASSATPTGRGSTGATTKLASLAALPRYSRSLLKVTVPVSVVLATKRESVNDVVELAPGTIVKFSKSCEEPLILYVGNQRVAEGEAVKVGDKFGFRVTGMNLPDEHFLKLRPEGAN